MRSAKQNAWTKSELMAAIENEAHQGTPVDNSEKVCYSDTSNLEEKNSDEVVVCKPREHMQKSHGGDYANKMHLLLDFTEAPGNIADPWYTENYVQMWMQVQVGCKGLLESLKKI